MMQMNERSEAIGRAQRALKADGRIGDSDIGLGQLV